MIPVSKKIIFCFFYHLKNGIVNLFVEDGHALLRASQGYGEQGNLPLLLLGTSANVFRELGVRIELGSSSTFLFREHLKGIFENKGDFGNISRKHRNTDPHGGP